MQGSRFRVRSIAGQLAARRYHLALRRLGFRAQGSGFRVQGLGLRADQNLELGGGDVERFQGGLVFKAHRLLYHAILGSGVAKRKKSWGGATGGYPFARALDVLEAIHFLFLRSGSRVQGSGCRIQGSGFGSRVQGSGFRVYGSGFMVQGSGFRVQGPGFRVQGSGSRVQGPGFGVQGS